MSRQTQPTRISSISFRPRPTTPRLPFFEIDSFDANLFFYWLFFLLFFYFLLLIDIGKFEFFFFFFFGFSITPNILRPFAPNNPHCNPHDHPKPHDENNLQPQQENQKCSFDLLCPTY